MAARTPTKPPREASGPSAYVAPRTGIFRILPRSCVPYAELMRLDRPAGYWAFYWHYAIGTAFAACIAPQPPRAADLARLAGSLALWVLVYRGAVCTWNDNIDRDLDRQVARCRHRPIARGAVSARQGHIFTVAQLVLCLALLAPCSSAALWTYAAAMTALLALYPFGKQVTHFPQAVLGFALAVPIFMCPAALGADPLARLPRATRRACGALALYLACALWTIIFDTIYAHQDIKDDIKAGVKSLAVRLGERTKLGLGLLGTVQVACLVATGVFCGLSWIYFTLACFGTGLSLVSMLARVELKKPSSCAWWFGPGSRFVGGSMVSALLGHYVLRIYVLGEVSRADQVQ